MSQPDDEETREQPAFPEPAQPEQPAQATPAMPQPPLAPAQPGSPPPQPTYQPQAPPPQPTYQPQAPPPQAGWQPQAPPPQPPPYQAPAAGYPQPTQGWQGQSNVPGWQQPAPGWQPQGQPGWQGPPPYAGAPGWQPQQPWAAQPRYGTSVLVVIAGLVLIAFGTLVAVIGGWSLTQGPEISRFIRDNDIAIFGRQIDRETMRTVLSPMPGILMVFGVLQLLVGGVLLAHRSWARWLGILLALLGLLVGVFAVAASMALVPGVSVQMLVSIVLLLGYAFVLLALIAGGSHFRARYPGR